MATASAAQAKPVPQGDVTIQAGAFHQIRNVAGDGNWCLQPEGGSTAEFARIVVNRCNGSLTQGWAFQQVGTNHYMFLNQLSGFCFDAFDGAFNGARLLQGTCKRISNEEFNTGTSLPAVTKIESRVGFRDTGFCVDVPGGNPSDNLPMQIWSCNGTPAQVFVIGF